MIPENFKTSLNIADRQLPGFVSENENYATFVAFLEAYYEWMAENGNVEERTKNLINYKDIDNTLNEFEQFFYNEFLTYFPEKTLANKRELVKLSKNLYRRKSTEAAYKFLFRALYNKDAELYNTRNSILIASDGKWVRSVYIKVESVDLRFLRTRGFKIFGERSKSLANIERIYPSSGKIEFQISDVKRSFESGEFIKIVDEDLNDLYFDSLGNVVEEGGVLLRSKIVGSITSLEIDPKNRGENYKIGDPVVFIGGLNPNLENSYIYEAVAAVKSVTVGSVTSIKIENGGNGFGLYPNSIVTSTSSSGSGLNARISEVDTTKTANVLFWGVETVDPYKDIFLDSEYGFENFPSANANSKLTEAFTSINFLSYPISKIDVLTGGSGYLSKPTINAESFFTIANSEINLKSLGILAPIEIEFGGFGYSNGEEIIISGGSGVGAFANVTNVDSNGTIKNISYYQKDDFLFPYGGMGYNNANLPLVSIANNVIYRTANNFSQQNSNTIILNSVANIISGMYVSGNGIANVTTLGIFDSNTFVEKIDAPNNIIILSNVLTSNNSANDVYKFDGSAKVVLKTVLGDGEILSSEVTKIGEILDFDIQFVGENYVEKPNTTLKIIDVRVEFAGSTSDISVLKSSMVYNSDTENALVKDFYGYIDRLDSLGQYVYNLRIYDYFGNIDFSPSNKLFVDKTAVNSKDFTFTVKTDYSDSFYTNGIHVYGNGAAQANVKFLSGTNIGTGKFLNTDGFLSSDKVLESEIYNDFSYFLTAEQEFKKYKEVVYNILHPGGLKLVSRNAIPTNNNIYINSQSNTLPRIELKYVTDSNVYGGFVPEPYNLASNNIVSVNNRINFPKPTNKFTVFDLRKESTNVSLTDVIQSNSYISLVSTDGDNFLSKVESIDDANDVIYFQDYKIITYENVARGYSNSNTIIVKQITNNFDIINNGAYSNSNNHFFDIVKESDYVYISNNYVKKIEKIDYSVNNWVIYANSGFNFNISGDANNLTNITVIRNFVANSIIIDYSQI